MILDLIEVTYSMSNARPNQDYELLGEAILSYIFMIL